MPVTDDVKHEAKRRKIKLLILHTEEAIEEPKKQDPSRTYRLNKLSVAD